MSENGHVRIEFEPLTSEFPDERDYDVRFRRTLGLRIEGVKPEAIKQVRILTRSAPARTTLRVELNAGAGTPGDAIRFDGYNARVSEIRPLSGCRAERQAIRWETGKPAVFELDVDHMTPRLPLQRR